MLDNNFDDFDLCNVLSLLGNDRSGWGHPIAAFAVPLHCQRHITGSIKVGRNNLRLIELTVSDQIRPDSPCASLLSIDLVEFG